MPQLPLDSRYPAKRRRSCGYLKSTTPYLAAFLLLSTGLVSYSLLSQLYSPARVQQIGWQAWETIDFQLNSQDDSPSLSNGTLSDAGIPLNVWDPMAKHTTGITELAIVPCILSPTILMYCQPQSTPEEDRRMGQWVLVDSDLNHRTGLTFLYLYYRRTRRLDVPLVTDMQIVADPPSADLLSSGWVQAKGNLRSGVFPRQDKLRLLFKTSEQGPVLGNKEHITEVMPHFGDGSPFFGFERVPGVKIMSAKAGRWESVDLVFRRGNPSPSKVEPPVFHSDGTLKIMQIADLHYSVGEGKCLDTDKEPCHGDADTATWLGEALDAEKPDMVIFSGDQLNGEKTAYDIYSVIAKFALPVIDRKIPWAAIFGNHDREEGSGQREAHMRGLMSLPYSLARAGPKDVDGVSNYVLKILSPDPSRTHIFTLYFVDSHAWQKSVLPYVDPGYDYLKPSQVEWIRKVSSSIKPIERPFRPDGANDLGHVWAKRRLETESRQYKSTLAKPNAMMWFHIPLPEAYDPADSTEDPDFAGTLELGHSSMASGASKTNGGFFSNALQAMLENDSPDHITEVKVLGHGHVHNDDRCRRVKGVWMCFNGGSSYSAYGKKGFDRRVRIYNISEWGETIATYKRTTSGEILDQQVLVGTGAPPGWGQAT